MRGKWGNRNKNVKMDWRSRKDKIWNNIIGENIWCNIYWKKDDKNYLRWFEYVQRRS